MKWKVVGGGDAGGIKVRAGLALQSAEYNDRLSTGALVTEKQLVGERLQYNLPVGNGTGPTSGWVSIQLKGKALLERTEAEEESHKTLDGPQRDQVPGEPFSFYHQVSFNDSKPTGVRMSACFCIMDETRIDLHACCDLSRTSLFEVTDPHIEIALELTPAMKTIGKDASEGGIMYTHPRSRGIVQSWIRSEGQWATPTFPFKMEEQNLFMVGKDKKSLQRLPLATGRFQKAFVAGEPSGLCTEAEFGEDLTAFFGKTKDAHTSDHLNAKQFKLLYPSAGQPFIPSAFTKVEWKMSYSFCDCWSRLYHAKVPELLWEVNTAAGGAFAKLVEGDPDPQAVVFSLPKKMDMGLAYDVLCFLDEAKQKGVYFLLPAGSKDKNEVVLAVCAVYDWDNAPADGKSLRQEDVEITGTNGCKKATEFAFASAEVKAGKVMDCTKLPSPTQS